MELKQRFSESIPSDRAVTIAKCADQVAGFPRYTMPCLMNIFAAQTELIAATDLLIENYCKVNSVSVLRKQTKFDCTDNPGTFSMCITVDCEFIYIGDKPFIVYWLDGKLEHIVGKDMQDAFTRAGYGAGAIHAVDWFDQATEVTHDYIDGKWERKVPLVV